MSKAQPAKLNLIKAPEAKPAVTAKSALGVRPGVAGKSAVSNPPPARAGATKGSPTSKAETRFRPAVIMLHLLGVLILVGGMVYITDVTRKYIEREVVVPVGPLRVALVNKPEWMSDFLAQEIAATVPNNSSSVFDHDMLVRTVATLQKNPWVAKVRQIRRAYGERPGDTLEVDCEFRTPIALVKTGQAYWMVDNDGYLLPEKFSVDQLSKITVGRDGRTTLRIVEGVRQPKPETGHKWVGADLAAGLDLIKLFYGKTYLDEVTAVDVGNFGGRLKKADPQILLDTKYGTQIWWGRPLNAKDYLVEVSATRKLEILQAVCEKHGRIDANQAYVDVRYDDVLIPTTQSNSSIQARTGE